MQFGCCVCCRCCACLRCCAAHTEDAAHIKGAALHINGAVLILGAVQVSVAACVSQVHVCDIAQASGAVHVTGAGLTAVPDLSVWQLHAVCCRPGSSGDARDRMAEWYRQF